VPILTAPEPCFGDYRRIRHSGDGHSTTVHSAVSVEFRFETAGDVIGSIESQVQAVLDDAEGVTSQLLGVNDDERTIPMT
jgi:hypothetical protein